MLELLFQLKPSKHLKLYIKPAKQATVSYQSLLPRSAIKATYIFESTKQDLYLVHITGHVNEYPTMHYFGNPGHTQLVTAHYDFNRVFLEIAMKNCVVGMLLTCPIHAAVMFIYYGNSSASMSTA